LDLIFTHDNIDEQHGFSIVRGVVLNEEDAQHDYYDGHGWCWEIYLRPTQFVSRLLFTSLVCGD
jgi:hypothetical protein